MGVVYRAEDKLIGRDVAIKTLAEVTPELRERFSVEARSGILNHVNIVTLYEVGEHEGVPFIAMEYLPGEPLEKILRARGRLPFLEVLSIVEQLCAGLGYAHQHGLVHRDVKPANVIVLPDGRVKIVDFGIARLVDDKERLTRTDAMLGTFHYVAPERLKGENSDGRADIWSVGVMLYEMVTGQLPFRGKDVAALYQVMHEPFTPIREIVDDSPEALSLVLNRALAKSVQERYATAEEMAIDLQVLGDGLKQERVMELLDAAQRLRKERQLGHARTSVLQAQRIDPANTTAKALLQELQEDLNLQQRGAQLRQTVEQAEQALAVRQFDEALTLYGRAAELDTGNVFAISQKIFQVQTLKEQQKRVRSLWQDASEARSRGDLARAGELLCLAIEIDDKSTDLRSAHAVILRELQRKQDLVRIEHLLASARDEYSIRQYSEAVAKLREAAEIDPTHEEVQHLLFDATTREKEERRRILLENVVAEIQKCMDAEEFQRAEDCVDRALEMLPAQITLVRLKAEIATKRRDQKVEQVVRTAMQESQEWFAEEPSRALAVIEAALLQAPAEERLTRYGSRLRERVNEMNRVDLRNQALRGAHELMIVDCPEEAIRHLEVAAQEYGETDELRVLLEEAHQKQAKLIERRGRESVLETARELFQARQYELLITRLGVTEKDEGDPELSAVVAEARQRLRAIEEQTKDAVARASARAEADPEGALEILDGQSEEVALSGVIQLLRKDLIGHAGCLRAIATAETQCEQLFAAGDYKGCVRELEKVGEVHGSPYALQQAQERWAARQHDFAEASLQQAMLTVKESLECGALREAVQAIRRGKREAEFVCEATLVQWTQLQEEVRQARIAKRISRVSSLRVGAVRASLYFASGLKMYGVWLSRGQRRIMLACLFGFLILVAGMWRVWRGTAPTTKEVQKDFAAEVQPHSPQPMTYLNVNAEPWATVISVKAESGKEIRLGTASNATPLRVDGLFPGAYAVVLRGPDGKQQVAQCAISLEQHLCVERFGALEIRNALAGERQ